MGREDDSDIAADLRIGPTTLGMVRIEVESATLRLPLDFDPDEAEEIAEELRAAAAAARKLAAKTPKPAAAEPAKPDTTPGARPAPPRPPRR